MDPQPNQGSLVIEKEKPSEEIEQSEPLITKHVKLDSQNDQQLNLAQAAEEKQIDNVQMKPKNEVIEITSNEVELQVIIEEDDEKNNGSTFNKEKAIIRKPFKLKEKKRGRKSQQEILSLKYKKSHHSNKCSSCKKGGTVLGCHHCQRAFHLECLNFKEEDIPKKFLCEKCKDKSKRQRQRDREKTKRKKQKENEKEKIKQLKLDNLLLDPTKKMGRPKREKNKEEHVKRFDEFAQKYTQYIDGKQVKFPIEDLLILMYDDLFPDIQIIQQKPNPKTNLLIPNEYMGQVIPIWNFLQTYSFNLTGDDFSLTNEEIFIAVDYKGEEILDIVNNLHQSLLEFVFKDLCEKNKIDNQKDLYDKPFFALTKYLYEINALNGVKPYVWTEYARNLKLIPYLSELFEEQSLVDIFEELAQYGINNYNNISTHNKLTIINTLISCVDESDSFHDVMSTKTDKLLEMSKEKNDLQAEIKKDESELLVLESNIRTLEENQKNKQIRLDLPRAEQLKLYREADKERKEINKNKSQVGKLKAQIEKKKARYEELQHILPFFLNTAHFLGMDVQKSEFWYFSHDPNRIYAYYKQNLVDEEIYWVYWDSKEDIENLVKCLNPKGIRERNLQKNIRFLLDTNHLFFEDKKQKTNQIASVLTTSAGNSVIDIKKVSEKDQTLIIENSESGEKERYEEQINVQENNNNGNSNDDKGVSSRKNSHSDNKEMQMETMSVEEEEKVENPVECPVENIAESDNKQRLEIPIQDVNNQVQTAIDNEQQQKIIAEQKQLDQLDPKIRSEMMKQQILQKFILKNDLSVDSANYTMTRARNAYMQRQNQLREKSATIQSIIDMILNCEEQFSFYLQKRKCRWLTSEKREDFKKIVMNCQEISPLVDTIVQMNEGFCHVDHLYFEDSYNNLPEEKKKKYFKEMHSDSDVEEDDDEFYFGAQAHRDSSHSNPANNAFLELERNPKINIKKIPIRIWGVFNEKLRKMWMNFEVDNITNLYFYSYVFCTVVERYVDRKLDQYSKRESQYNGNNKEEKQQAFHYIPKKEKKLINVNDLEQYKYNATYQTEQQRENQEKLNELLNLRRSDRTKDLKRRQIYHNLNEQQWDDQCKKCGDFGDVICCETCPSVFHPECIGLKQIPEGKWNCFDCLERFATQMQSTRQTRSLSKRYGI